MSTSTSAAAQGYDSYRFRDAPQFEWAYGESGAHAPPADLARHRAQFDLLVQIANDCASAMWSTYSAADSGAQWMLYRRRNGDASGNAVLWQRSNAHVASPDADVSAVYGPASLPAGFFERVARAANAPFRAVTSGSSEVPTIIAPTSAITWGYERGAATICHELLHAIHVGTASARAGNSINDIWRYFSLYILTGSRERAANEGMPRWLSEGIGNAQVWMMNNRTLAGRTLDLYAWAARAPQVRRRDLDTIGAPMRILGVRSYADSVFIDNWPHRSALGTRAAGADMDTYYATSSFHRWIARRVRWGNWFSAVSNIRSLRRDYLDRTWIYDFGERLRERHPYRRAGLCSGSNCGLRELVGTFLGAFAHEYEKVPGSHREGLFSQAGWLRWVFPPDGCTTFVFRPDGTIVRSETRPDGQSFSTTVTEATVTANDVDPYSGRCVQLAALDRAGNRRAATFDLSISPVRGSNRPAASQCEDFVLSGRSARGAVRLSARPRTDSVNNEVRASTDCFSSTLIDAEPTERSPNAIAVVAYAPELVMSAREASFTIRISESFSDTTRTNPPAVGGATQKPTTEASRSASRAAPPASEGTIVARGAVIHHDEGAPSANCDRQWEHFCEPTSTISVATSAAGASAMEGLWAFPPSQITDLPEEYTAAAIGNMSLSLAGQGQLTYGGRTPPDTVSIVIPRIRPGVTGVIQRAVITQNGDTSAGPNALRVDARCNNRYFEPQGTVTITLNDGVRIAGTFEAPMFTDNGAQRDREGCIRVRRRVGSIRGRFSTGFLSSGWFFQDTHSDYPTIAGVRDDADFDRPQAWLGRTRRALAFERQQLPPEERARRDAEGEQTVMRMIGAGVGVSLPTQCRCDCGEYLNVLTRSSCAASCREPFARFEREPAVCAGQQATVVAPPVQQTANGANGAPAASVEAEWQAFLERMPRSARASLQRQVERMEPSARPVMMQTIMRMMGAMQGATPAR